MYDDHVWISVTVIIPFPEIIKKKRKKPSMCWYLFYVMYNHTFTMYYFIKQNDKFVKKADALTSVNTANQRT